MTVRYLALIGPALQRQVGLHDKIDAAIAAAMPDMRPAHRQNSMILFTNAKDSRYVELGNGGFILGNVFQGLGKQAKIRRISPAALKAISASRGENLIEDYWGGYVAILPDPIACQMHVIRDPSAALPCYYVRRHGVFAVSSDVELLIAAGVLQPEIDWSGVAVHLLADQLRPAATCIANVVELLGGERLSVGSRDHDLGLVWSPWKFAGRDRQIQNPAVAAAQLHEVTSGCVTAWASAFQHVLLGISGGLDSSIVAGCLRSAGAAFSCLTLVTDDPRGDERQYARVLAQALDVPLHEELELVERINPDRSLAAHLPRPTARLFAQSGDQVHLDIANRVGADAFFSGGGGDNVFCYMQSALPVADRLLQEGFGRGALATASDMSRLAHCSLWHVMRNAVRKAWLQKPGYCWRTNSTFLTPKVIGEADRRISHPWLVAPDHALPGKAAHIAWLMHIQNHLEGYGRELVHPMIWPLMSQPLVELCLQIPTWLWCLGGRNRSIARQAFAEDLPVEIIARRSKGTPDGFVAQIFEAKRESIRNLLLDGLLADRGLLDRNALASTLDNPASVGGVDYTRIMMLADVEAWIRSWVYRSSQPALSSVPSMMT